MDGGERRERKKGMCVDRDTRSLEAGRFAADARRRPAVARAACSQARNSSPPPCKVDGAMSCLTVSCHTRSCHAMSDHLRRVTPCPAFMCMCTYIHVACRRARRSCSIGSLTADRPSVRVLHVMPYGITSLCTCIHASMYARALCVYVV